ncbi:MAG: CHASE2 domain-containing protein [Dehalococcoidales bacterium]|nr:CHASE2 domain-containing protein [Dehalococcoidales bacterium]
MIIRNPFKVKRNQQQPRLLYHTLILLVVGCSFILFVTLVQPFYSINLWLADQLFVSEPPSPNIVVIGIDDDTLQTHGRWASWPRSLHAQAIGNLNKAGAKVIGFDILFAESTPEDEILATAIRGSGNLILSLVGTEPEPSTDMRLTYTQIITPTSLLRYASTSVGHGNILTDPDGKVRRLPMVIRDGSGQTYPAFSLAVLHSLFSTPLPQEMPGQSGMLHVLGREIPIDDSYCYRINFAPEDAGRPYVSYKDIISGDFDPRVVADKIVLIGMVATGELDKWAVPTSSGQIPGVYIQAAIVDNILRQQFVTGVGNGTTMLILLLIMVLTAIALPRFRLRWGGMIVGALFVGYLVISFVTFEWGYILNILYPLLMLPTMYTSSSLTQNVAMAVENTKLNRKVLEGYKGTIRALAAAIDAKDHYTRGHSQRVTEFALLGAKSLNMSPEEIEVLEYAGILHDVGKIGIPDRILSKPSRLTQEEFEIIKQHPSLGANIITGIPFLEEARRLALHHHEKFDGTGYPDGLKGDEIPLGARLLAVADAFDSMTTDRAYRAAMGIEDALNELKKHRGTQFCPVAVDAFISALQARSGKAPSG